MVNMRQDLKSIELILTSIRSKENKLNRSNVFPKLLTAEEAQYLIITIWRGRSAVSEEKDLYQLAMPRFNPDEIWSPWNCILLTRDEADFHEKLKTVHHHYSNTLVTKIKNFHRTARLRFR